MSELFSKSKKAEISVEGKTGLPHRKHTYRSGLNTEGKLKKMIILPDFGEDEDE